MRALVRARTSAGMFVSSHMKSCTTAWQVPLRPRDAAALAGLARLPHSWTLADERPGVARELAYVFGDAQCAERDAVFSVG